jgi:dihydroxyacetone kinase
MMGVDDRRLALLDAPTDAPAWPNAAALARTRETVIACPSSTRSDIGAMPAARTDSGTHVESVIRATLERLKQDAPLLNELDRAVGDGDLGTSLSRAADAVLEALPGLPLIDPAGTLRSLGLLFQKTIGGTSGPLYGVLFLRAAGFLKNAGEHGPIAWADSFGEGTRAVAALGGAQAGDRTMLDALLPAAAALRSALDRGASVSGAVDAAARAARAGAVATETMPPRRGRSSYLGERALGHPDPGAVAVTTWLEALREAIAALD